MSQPPATLHGTTQVTAPSTETTRPVQGPVVTSTGVTYYTWSAHHEVTLIIYRADGAVARSLRMPPIGNGFFTVTDPDGKPGDLYKYSFGGQHSFPDPVSRYQPSGVHGPSLVVENSFQWNDADWVRPNLDDLVIYELHLGTFTPEGTFAAAIEKLRHLADIGFNAIEIMPVADFPGHRNWGYDGVSAYAPARTYGKPDDFRALINAAHARGIAVILDVVYNHFGPDGNYLSAFNPGYFHPSHNTPWGDSFNFELPPVRDFFLQNIAYWMDEFHVDGFRLDATHAIVDSSETHILTDIARIAHDRGGFVIAEDDRNEPRLVRQIKEGGMGLDGCWADDFHHILNVMLTGTRDAYFKNYQGTVDELVETLSRGWLFTGQIQATNGKPRGGDPGSLLPQQLVYCISNHDQVGNRAFGERLRHLISPAAFRAASALLLLAPYTPLVFMGQEWAASSPFQYFTDHNADLGHKVIIGRRREFREFAAFRDPAVREQIPSPQAEETFRRSKLNWDERDRPESCGTINLYRTCIRLRNTVPCLQNRSRDNWRVVKLSSDVIAIVYGLNSDDCCVLAADLTGAGIFVEAVKKQLRSEGNLETVFSSNNEQFGGGASGDRRQAETILLQVI